MKTLIAVFIVLVTAACAFPQSDVFSAKSLYPTKSKEGMNQLSYQQGMLVNREFRDSIEKKIAYYTSAREKLSTDIKSLNKDVEKGGTDRNEKKEKLLFLNAEASKISEYINDLYGLYLLELKGAQEKTKDTLKKEDAFSVNPNLGINTSGTGKNSIVPELNAGFESELWDSSKNLFCLKLNIKSPVQANDSAAYYTDVMKSGGDGILDVSLKHILFKTDDYGGMVSVGDRFCWMYTKDNDSIKTSAYVFNGFYGFAAFRIFSFIIGADMQYSIARKSTNELTSLINDSWNANMFIGIRINEYQIFIKYLLWNSKLNNIKEDNRLEIKLGISFNPF